ncbi:VOC family protein [Dongia soli]|uniref:VOC family protein n=1 Tax=Dongia soli TaxID=600628 RepID=A0ABU5EFX5_9PROT|nr:VOC family protein [Dongia soli]MDY0884496.1 VOC family protein [Dongia soli]
MEVQPYLFFDGRCEEAIEFYRKTLKAEVVMMMRFKDNPDLKANQGKPQQEAAACMPADLNKIMHSALRIGETMILASDGRGEGKPEFKGISLALTAASESEADQVFAALSDGGQVQLPLTKTFFSPRFGIVADRFGVNWMVVTKS